MSADAARKDFDALCGTISRGLRGAVFVAIPATAGLFLVAKPLVSAVFEHGEFTADDTTIVAWTLSFYAIGLTGFFAQQIITRAFYSMQNSKAPARSALVAVFVNIVLNLTLIWFMGTAGLALSTAICSYLQVFVLVFVLRKTFSKSILAGLGGAFVKTLAATVLMFLVGAGIMRIMSNLSYDRPFNILRLAVVVPSAAVMYLIAAKFLNIEMLSLFLGRKGGDEPSA